MSREMIINVAQSEECRIAVIEDGQLQELYIERSGKGSLVGNIYKGKIVNIEPGIQAAFIDFGNSKNGFLHISDLHPKYFSGEVEDVENIGKRKALKDRPPIQQCLKKGMDMIVQVTKDGIKSKGPTLSTYISLPGKYLVLMPWMKRLGVSHKVENDEERERLRQLLNEIKIPDSVGVIIRTAAEGAAKKDIRNDLAYLLRLWTAIEKRIEGAKSPADLYQESDLIIRTLRDIFNSQVDKVICDSEETTKKICDFISIAMPKLRKRIIYYDGKTPLFDKYDIEKEITKINSHRVELSSGGSLVIEQTEALVAIDVNSGRYRQQADAEKTAKKINSEAVKEIVRQLKLRDMGGLIICDFIDMRSEKNRREVEKEFRAAVRSDRARTKILKMSSFGIIEMTRQRMRPSLQLSTALECPYCLGSGYIKTQQSLTIEVLRKIELAVSRKNILRVELCVSPEFANYILNDKRARLAELELQSGKKIIIKADISLIGEKYIINGFDEREGIVKV